MSKISPLTVLFAPAHILVDDTQEGSEYNWPYKLIERLVLDHGVHVIALTVQPRVERELQGVTFVSVDPGGALPMSNLERLRFHLRVYIAARKILASGQHIDLVHHMLPFGFRATFNMLALLRRHTDPPIVFGPLQNPLSVIGDDERRVAVRDFSPMENDARKRRTKPSISTFITTPTLSALSARTLRRSAELVAISEQAARLYQGIAPSSPLTIIPAGVDTAEFTPRLRSPAVIESDAPQSVEIIAVGYFIERKAFDVLIKAVGKLISEALPVRLRLVGDGPARGNLEALVHQLGIGQFVSFAGLVPHSAIMHEYHHADIFCSTSLSESFSIVGLEAMSCGLPVVATPTGFFREALRREQVGMSVRFGAVDDLATALAQLTMDQRLRETLGRQARALAVREYDWRIIARQYFALYQRVISRRVAQ